MHYFSNTFLNVLNALSAITPEEADKLILSHTDKRGE